MTKNDWVVDDNNFRYFNQDGNLIAHIFKAQGIWQGYVLGYDKTFKDIRFTEILVKVDKALKECGWEKMNK